MPLKEIQSFLLSKMMAQTNSCSSSPQNHLRWKLTVPLPFITHSICILNRQYKFKGHIPQDVIILLLKYKDRLVTRKYSYPDEGWLQLWLSKSKTSKLACNNILKFPKVIFPHPQLKTHVLLKCHICDMSRSRQEVPCL